MSVPDEGYHREISEELARQLKQLLDGGQEQLSVLVVGLGQPGGDAGTRWARRWRETCASQAYHQRVRGRPLLTESR